MKSRILLLILILPSPLINLAQTYSCANENYKFLKKALGEWEVQTRDRVAVGEYENNEGMATVVPSIEGCGISISFRGIYKGKDYSRIATITGLDSTRVQMVAMDSEHGGFSTYEGQIEDEQLEVKWFREKEVGRLETKYLLSFINESEFEFSSYLSNDGETWALTHQRNFKKILARPQACFIALIVKDLDASIKWYSELLGFTVVNQNNLESRGIFMANLASGKNRLELIQIDSSVSSDELLEPKQKMQGFFKAGFLVKALEPYIAQLKDWDPNFNESIVSDPVSGQKMIVFKDPDGNRIQLFEE